GVAYNAPAYNTTFTFSTPAAIGARGESFNDSFLGTIDEVSIYNRALSASEVQSVYTAGGFGKCVPTPPPTCTPPPAGLVSWWRGEGNALDQAGTNNGTLVGTVIYGPGEVGQGFVFD